MFRTELPLTPHPSQLPLAARVLTIGSCFSDTIGGRLARTKVSTLVNPFGTVFNPLSACKLLRAAAGEEMDWQQHLVEARGRWQSYDLPATVGADSPVTLLQQIRDVVQQTGRFLETADVVVLTLGTAFAYRLLETQEVVGNCHKIPAEKFEKELLTPDEVINAVAETHAFLRLKNPKLRFILTVSPVRHLKDTLPLNAVSKSVLRVACHYLSELLPDVSYFPAYELLLDDLRDYRFYAPDMLHPSDVAENYIWERFTRTYFDPAFGRFKKEWEAVQQSLGHRPLYPAAPEHRAFLESTLERLEKLASQADVHLEIRDVQRQLAALPPPPQPQPEIEPEPDDDEERIDIGEGSAPVAIPSQQGEPQRPARIVEQPIRRPEPAAPAQAEVSAPVASEPEAEEATTEILPDQPKKKRRSRGGAKRTARKNAARAALEAAQQSAASIGQVVEPATAMEPEAESETLPEVPLLTQELEVVHELPPVPETAPEPTTPVPEPVRPAPAAPVERAPNVDWLRPMKDDNEEATPAKRPVKGIVRTPPTRKAKQPIATPPRSGGRKAPAAALPTAAEPEALPTPVAEVAAAPAPVEVPPAPQSTPPAEASVEETPPAVEAAAPAAEPTAVAEKVTKAKAPKKAAAKPAAKAAAKPAKPKAASKTEAKPKAAGTARRKTVPPTAEATGPAATPPPVEPAAAPPKRVRPPRKKPAAPDENA